MSTPYYADEHVTLYLGDYREHLPELRAVRADAIITDPPYGETTLKWDRWQTGWPIDVAVNDLSNALWCFGSMRMFMEHRDEFFLDWKFSHEIVWRKHQGSGFVSDKFRRIHELAALWYRGSWADLQHEVPRIASTRDRETPRVHRNKQPEHMGQLGAGTWVDDGTRMQTSVIEVRSEHHRAVHPTQKPLGIVTPLIEFSVPRGGVVVDLFSGSGTVALAARNLGRRCVAVETNEAYCEIAAERLSHRTLDFGDWDGAA